MVHAKCEVLRHPGFLRSWGCVRRGMMLGCIAWARFISRSATRQDWYGYWIWIWYISTQQGLGPPSNVFLLCSPVFAGGNPSRVHYVRVKHGRLHLAAISNAFFTHVWMRIHASLRSDMRLMESPHMRLPVPGSHEGWSTIPLTSHISL